MRRIDIPISEIGSHSQTFSVAGESLGGDEVFLCGSTLSMNALFWKLNCIHWGISKDRSIEELIKPSH